MELSPLELYETAYKLHYIDRKISNAVLAYEKLIKEFPESNECGYAVIQLQKIRSANLSEEINRADKSPNPLPVIAFVIALLGILACGATVWYFKKLLEEEKYRTTLTTTAIGKLLRGDDDDALRVLAELKDVDKGNITPFELSADIYRKRDDLKKAAGEYELFFKLNPERIPTDAEKAIMNNDRSGKKSKQKTSVLSIDGKEGNSVFNDFLSEDLKDNDKVKEDAVPVSVQNKKLQLFDSLGKQNTEVQNMPVKKAVQPKAPVKGLFVVDPDSLSYF
jgi:tetratricopeptide (TPR) repeat protein